MSLLTWLKKLIPAIPTWIPLFFDYSKQVGAACARLDPIRAYLLEGGELDENAVFVAQGEVTSALLNAQAAWDAGSTEAPGVLTFALGSAGKLVRDSRATLEETHLDAREGVKVWLRQVEAACTLVRMAYGGVNQLVVAGEVSAVKRARARAGGIALTTSALVLPVVVGVLLFSRAGEARS